MKKNAMVAAVMALTCCMSATVCGNETWWDEEQKVSWRWTMTSESQQRILVYLCDRDRDEGTPTKEITLPLYVMNTANGTMLEVGRFSDYLFRYGPGHTNADGLESVVIPDASVLDTGTFKSCTDLKSVTFLGTIPIGLDFESVFAGTPYLAGLREANGNDLVENARELAGAVGSATDNNYLASPRDFDEDGYEPLMGFASWLVGTKWYKWTAPATATAWFDTYGSDFNTVLGVYEMDYDEQQTPKVRAVKGENGDYNGVSSRVSFSAEQNKTYYICVGGEQAEVDGLSSSRGNIVLNWRTGTPVKLTLVTGLTGKNKKAITMTAYVPKAKAAGALPTPKRTGYLFQGWFTKVTGGTRVLPTSKFNKATTLYAHWMIRSYRLSVKADDETKEGCKSVTGGGNYVHGKKVTITATANAGYKFGMWMAPEYEPTDTEFKNYYTLCRKNAAAAVTVYGRNMWYEAYFVAEADDYMDLAVEDDSGTPDLATTWYAEDTKSISIYLVAESKTYPTVTTTKLPAGATFKLAEDYTADAGEIERRDARYRFSVPNTTKLAPGKHTVTVTAKNRWGQTATKILVVYGPNKTAANAWLPGIRTSANEPYRMQVGLTPTLGDTLGIATAAGCKITKIAGLPAGLTWDAKKQKFTGAPTKAGTYTLTFTVTKVVNKKTQTKTSSITVEVEPLPDGLVGTFNGYTLIRRQIPDNMANVPPEQLPEEYAMGVLCADSKPVTVTVASSGKVTAKVGSSSFTGGTLTFVPGEIDPAAPAASPDTYESDLRRKVTLDAKKKIIRQEDVHLSINPSADKFAASITPDFSRHYWYEGKSGGTPTYDPFGAITAKLNRFGFDDDWQAVARTVANAADTGTVTLYAWAKESDPKLLELTQDLDQPPNGYAPVLDAQPQGDHSKLFVTVDSATGVATLSGTLGGTSMSGTAVLSPEIDNDRVGAEAYAAYARFFTGGFVIEVKYPLEASATTVGFTVGRITGRGWQK